MTDLHLTLAADCLERFPDLAAGGFLVEDLHLAATALGDLANMEQGAREALAARGLTTQKIADDPLIVGWRKALGMCDLKPSTFKSSVEQLARRYLKGETIRTPLPIVNLYCIASVHHMAPTGGYDLERLPSPEIAVRFYSPSSDRFQPLGGRANDFPIREGVPVYASGDEVICFGFNHRDSAATCLRSTTSTAVFFSEAVTPAQHKAMDGVLKDLSVTLRSLGGRPGEVQIADSRSRRIMLTT